MNTVLLIISYIISFIHLYLKPEKIPSHWNIKGEVNAYMSYPWGIIVYPAMITILFLLSIFLKKIDPFLKKNTKKWLPIISILMSIFIVIQIYVIIYMFFTPTFNLFPLIFGIFFIFMGNYFPILPRNGFIGIRTPWTFSSEYVWQKTHKISGYLAIILGALMIIFSFTKYSNITFYFMIIWAIISILISFIVWKTKK